MTYFSSKYFYDPRREIYLLCILFPPPPLPNSNRPLYQKTRSPSSLPFQPVFLKKNFSIFMESEMSMRCKIFFFVEKEGARGGGEPCILLFRIYFIHTPICTPVKPVHEGKTCRNSMYKGIKNPLFTRLTTPPPWLAACAKAPRPSIQKKIRIT